jgi:hypothetical protein
MAAEILIQKPMLLFKIEQYSVLNDDVEFLIVLILISEIYNG